LLERILRSGRGHHRIMPLLERVANQLAHILIIIDNKYAAIHLIHPHMLTPSAPIAKGAGDETTRAVPIATL
jgi:hypothetical protein